MITRTNYFDVLNYLEYQERVFGRSYKTIDRKWAHLRHVLEWADDTPLEYADKIFIPFPKYLESARNDGKNIKLSPESMNRACIELRAFFRWLKIQKAAKYKSIPEAWIDTIRPGKENSPQSEIKEIEFYTQEEVSRLCNFFPERLIDMRDRASVALAFVTGIRVSALVSLPIKCISIDDLEVKQLPKEGVSTKDRKAQITYMLPLMEFIEIISEWLEMVKNEYGEDGLWYPSLSTDGTQFLPLGQMGSTESRRMSFSRSLKRFSKRAGVDYKSPHKLRHAHGKYIRKISKNYDEFKAYSQNMGHESTQTTEKYYSGHSTEEIKNIVTKSESGSQINLDVDSDTLKEFREFQAFKKWQANQGKE